MADPKGGRTMKIKDAITLFQYHQQSSLKQRTKDSYRFLLQRFGDFCGDREFESIGSDAIFQFLEGLTRDQAKATRRLRYAQIKSFYNFAIEKCAINTKNPCNGPLFSKAFRAPKQVSKNILDKESVDELIYNTRSPRDRLIMELQARCGLRIGELLKITVSDISERKLLIREPKSGKEGEVAFMPEQVAKRVDEYIRSKNLSGDKRLFPISYSTARSMIKKMGNKLNLKITPHDLRRYSATYASRNGIPLEIISKIILRHQDLKTTQVYLGKVSESEAIRWMDILHGK